MVFQDPALKARLGYEPELGFLTTGMEGDAVTVLGFSPLDRAAGLPATAYSVTEYADLDPQDQTIDLQGKGVGWRLYNTAQAVAGRAVQCDQVAAYTITIDRASILDTRQPTDSTMKGKLQRIARHGGRMLMAASGDLETVVHAVHLGYGDNQAVLFSQPPRARLRERMRLVRPPVPSEFLIIRSASLALHGAGVRAAPGLSLR
ncbi:MAG TPA: hypothetical protein VLH86_01340 [Patescibacteria group bacterium]|nr:hypothetical protein [Patescibacteria group bacterium]